MCAQYMMAKGRKDLKGRYSSDTRIEPNLPEWDERIVPYRPGPVVATSENGPVLRLMQFSLVPSWSKEPRVKFATHNARLDSIDPKTGKIIPIFEKPTWREPFRRHHCLVPMTGFIEPIYTGELAGNMIQFSSHSDELLWAAGIWDSWVNKSTGEIIESFAVLSDEPDPFVAKIGHDRTPVFLIPEAADQWLNPKISDSQQLIELLRKGRNLNVSWQTSKDRPLKAGWEKRIKDD